MDYKIPSKTRIGHVHLKVADLERALGFYSDLLGFELMQKFGDSAAFISAGGYHHHIGLNTWQSKDQPLHQNSTRDYSIQLFFIQKGKNWQKYFNG